MLSEPGANGVWGVGQYENAYVKERGTWKIGKLHFYVQAMADYATVRGYQQMHTILAESLAYDVHGWLARFGFKATGVINEAFHNYGTVEDGIRFDRQL